MANHELWFRILLPIILTSVVKLVFGIRSMGLLDQTDPFNIPIQKDAPFSPRRAPQLVFTNPKDAEYALADDSQDINPDEEYSMDFISNPIHMPVHGTILMLPMARQSPAMKYLGRKHGSADGSDDEKPGKHYLAHKRPTGWGPGGLSYNHKWSTDRNSENYLTGKIEDGHPPEKIPMPKDGVVRSTKQTDSVPALANEGPMSAASMGDDGGRLDDSASFGTSRKQAGSWWSKRLQGGTNQSPDPFMEGTIPGDKKSNSQASAHARARSSSAGIAEGRNAYTDGSSGNSLQSGLGRNWPGYDRNAPSSAAGTGGSSNNWADLDREALSSGLGTNWPGYGREAPGRGRGAAGLPGTADALSSGLGTNWPGYGRETPGRGVAGLPGTADALSSGLGTNWPGYGRDSPGRGVAGLPGTPEALSSGLGTNWPGYGRDTPGRGVAGLPGTPEALSSGLGTNWPGYGRDTPGRGVAGLPGTPEALSSGLGTNWPGYGRETAGRGRGVAGLPGTPEALSSGLGTNWPGYGRDTPGRGVAGLPGTPEALSSGLGTNWPGYGRKGFNSAIGLDGLASPYYPQRLAVNGGTYGRLSNQDLVNAAFGKAPGRTESALGGNNQGYDPTDGSSAGISKGLASAFSVGRSAGIEPGGVMNTDFGMEHVPGAGDPAARAELLSRTGFAPSYRSPAQAVAEAALAGGATAEAAAALNNRVQAMAGLNDAQSWAMQSLEGNYAPVMQEADNSYVMVDGPVVFGYPKGPPTERPVVTKPTEKSGSYGGAKNITHYHLINGVKVPYKWEMVTFPPIDEE